MDAALLGYLTDQIMHEIEGAGGDVKEFCKHPLGKALIEKTVRSGRWRPAEFREMVQKLLALMPFLCTAPKTHKAIPLPPMS